MLKAIKVMTPGQAAFDSWRKDVENMQMKTTPWEALLPSTKERWERAANAGIMQKSENDKVAAYKAKLT